MQAQAAESSDCFCGLGARSRRRSVPALQSAEPSKPRRFAYVVVLARPHQYERASHGPSRRLLFLRSARRMCRHQHILVRMPRMRRHQNISMGISATGYKESVYSWQIWNGNGPGWRIHREGAAHRKYDYYGKSKIFHSALANTAILLDCEQILRLQIFATTIKRC